MKYNFNFKQQFLQGIAAFFVSLIILYFFKGEWGWSLAFGVGLGNFIVSGFNPENCK